MALTSAQLRFDRAGNRRLVTANVTFDASYATGGEAFTPASVGMHSFDVVLIEQASGYQVVYDRANAKLKVYTPSNAAAAHTHTHTTHLHTTTTDNVDTGGTIAGEGAAGAITAGAGTEVANATNLSTLAIRVVAFGE